MYKMWLQSTGSRILAYRFCFQPQESVWKLFGVLYGLGVRSKIPVTQYKRVDIGRNGAG